jgi:hypothetical protein
MDATTWSFFWTAIVLIVGGLGFLGVMVDGWFKGGYRE